MQEVADQHMDQEFVVGEMETITAGSIDFGLDYRHFAGDEGVAIHVYADLEGKRTELLRFDCFVDAPHYHYGPDGRDERLFLDCTADGAPIPWALNKLRSRMVPMLVRAGYSQRRPRPGPRSRPVSDWTWWSPGLQAFPRPKASKGDLN